MIAKHTPGPWSVRISGTMTGRGPEVYREGAHYDDGSEFVIAECGVSETANHGTGMWKRTVSSGAIGANSRLIAAAPDLLAAANAICHAIAFATQEELQGAIKEAYVQCRTAIAKAEGR